METLLQLYESMSWVRCVEEKIAREYSNEEMRCPVHLSVGQEAVPVGVSFCLKADDHIVSAHRSHAHYLARGGSLEKMFGEILGRVTGCARGKGGSMHLFDLAVNVTAAVPIVGSSIPIGTGIGLGLKQQGKGGVVVVYLGDGATEEGCFAESLDFASLMNLPIIFVCENNHFSVYTPLDRRQSPNRNLQKICLGHGVKYFKSDGNDVRKVVDTMNEASKFVQFESKPVFLDFETFRWLEHCGPNWDDHLGYRDESVVKQWIKRCPLKNAEKELLEMGVSHQQLNQISEKNNKIVDEVFEACRLSKFPHVSELYEHVYSS